jgi:hypothetical protein
MSRFLLEIKFWIYLCLVYPEFFLSLNENGHTFLVWHRHYAGYKQGDPGYGAKSLAELENQRNNDQQGGNHGQSGQLYSPSPARKGDSSLSGQKGSDTSGMSSTGKDNHWLCQYMFVWCLDRRSLKNELVNQISYNENQIHITSHIKAWNTFPWSRTSLDVTGFHFNIGLMS